MLHSRAILKGRIYSRRHKHGSTYIWCEYTCIYIYMCETIDDKIHVYIWICMYSIQRTYKTCIYIYIYIFICLFLHMFIYTRYLYTYADIHTLRVLIYRSTRRSGFRFVVAPCCRWCSGSLVAAGRLLAYLLEPWSKLLGICTQVRTDVRTHAGMYVRMYRM